MKLNIKHIKFFSFCIAKELGYIGEKTLEGVKQFLSDNYNIIWDKVFFLFNYNHLFYIVSNINK